MNRNELSQLGTTIETKFNPAVVEEFANQHGEKKFEGIIVRLRYYIPDLRFVGTTQAIVFVSQQTLHNYKYMLHIPLN